MKKFKFEYQRFTPSSSGAKNIGIRKSEFVKETQFLFSKFIFVCFDFI